MRKTSFIIAVLAGVIAGTAATILCFHWRGDFWSRRLDLRTYFQNAEGLRAGAPVQLAGVDVGRVTAVRAQTAHGKDAAEVLFWISTTYELKIPSDATATLATAGVLGGTFLQIDTRGASGPPAVSGTTLKSVEPPTLSSTHYLKSLKQILTQIPCKPDESNSQANLGKGAKGSPK